MGGRTDSDGRLDLDELGSVIESADVAPTAEQLHDGLGRPSVAEHLEDAGVLPWLRRHRPLVGAAVVVGLGGLVALAVHQANQPPPLDPQVVAQVTSLPVPVVTFETPVDAREVDSDLARVRVLLSGVPQGDTVEVVGLTGPGLGATSAGVRDDDAIGGTPVEPDPTATLWSAAATIDCAGPRALTAEAGDFAVALQRTDRWGRTVRATVPLDAEAARVAGEVRRLCWMRAVQEGIGIDALDARPDPSRATVSVGIVLRNSTPLDLVAGSEPQELDGQGLRVGQSFRVALAAGLGADTEVLLSITSCDRAAPPTVSVAQSRDGGTVAVVPGLDLYAASPDRASATLVPAALDAEQTAAVRAALQAVCAGAPDIALRAVGTPVVQALGGPLDERQMRIALDVRTTGVVREVTVDGDAGLPTVFSATSTADGPGPVEAVWRFTCANTPAPPRVSVTVTDGGRTWPWRGVLAREAIERAVLRACPSQSAMSLAAMGWPALLQVRG